MTKEEKQQRIEDLESRASNLSELIFQLITERKIVQEELNSLCRDIHEEES